MFPHEQLTALVAAALWSPSPRHNHFAGDWASRLGDPVHATLWAHMTTRYADRLFVGRYYETLVQRLPMEELIRVMADHPHPQVRQQIVHHLHYGRGRDVENFLLACDGSDDELHSATQALAMLRATRAGPHFRKALAHRDSWVRSAAARGVATTVYAPALPELVSELERGVDSFHAVTALGRLAVDRGWRALVDHARRATSREGVAHVLHALTLARDPATLPYVREVLEGRAEWEGLLIDGLTGRDFDGPVDAWLSEPPWIADDALFEQLWAYARTKAAPPGAHWRLAFHAVEAFSHFVGLLAARRLRELALADAPADEASVDAEFRRRARELLASRRDADVVASVVAEHLDRYAKDAHSGWLVLPRVLAPFDRTLVAAELRSRIARGVEPVVRWVEVLTRFADDSDRGLFEELERSPSAAIADLAHEFLIERRLLPATLVPVRS